MGDLFKLENVEIPTKHLGRNGEYAMRYMGLQLSNKARDTFWSIKLSVEGISRRNHQRK